MSLASDSHLVIHFMDSDIYVIYQAYITCLGHRGKCLILNNVWLNGQSDVFSYLLSFHIYIFAFCRYSYFSDLPFKEQKEEIHPFPWLPFGLSS